MAQRWTQPICGVNSARGGADGYRPGYELVAERILELVAARRLRSGDYLGSEIQRAGRLDVSRTVTCETVKVLSGASGVEFFLPADVDHVHMSFEFRVVHEEAASNWQLSGSPPDFCQCAEAAAETKAAVLAGYQKSFGKWDDTFHDRLTEAATTGSRRVR